MGALAPLLAAHLYALLYRREWVGEWNWTVDAAIGSTTLAGPVLVGVGALVGVRLRRTLPLVVATPRFPAVVVRAALEVWLVGCLAFVGTAATALLLTAWAIHGGPFTVAALLLGPAVLGVASFLGVLAGFTLPTWATVAVAAPAFFVAGAVAPEWVEGLFRQGPVTGSLAGLAYAETTALATAAGAVSTSVLCVVWIAVRRPGLRVAAALGCLVSLGVSSAMSATMTGERFEPGHERATVCDTLAGVVVCVAPSNTARLGPLTSAVATAVGALRAEGVAVPARFDALVPYADPVSGRGLLPGVTVAWSPYPLVLSPAPCPQWLDPNRPPPAAVFEAQQLMVRVLELADGHPPATGAPYASWLEESTSRQRRAWISSEYAKLRACRLDDIELPPRAL